MPSSPSREPTNSTIIHIYLCILQFILLHKFKMVLLLFTIYASIHSKFKIVLPRSTTMDSKAILFLFGDSQQKLSAFHLKTSKEKLKNIGGNIWFFIVTQRHMGMPSYSENLRLFLFLYIILRLL